MCYVCINRGCEMIGMLVCRLFRFNHRLTAIKKAELTTSTGTLIPRYQDCPEHVTDSESRLLSAACVLFVGTEEVHYLHNVCWKGTFGNMKCDVMMTRVMLKVAR